MQVSKSVRLHHLASFLANLFCAGQNIASKMFSAGQKTYQLASECNHHRPYIHISKGRLAYLTPGPLDYIKHVLFFSLQFQVMTECTRKRPCFHYFFCISNTVRMHHVPFLFSFFSAVTNRFKYRQNACFIDIFSAVLKCIKYYQNACFRDIVFIFVICSSKSFQIPS